MLNSISSQTPVRILVKMRGITKRFGGAPALRDAALDILTGEVHVLAGENGAGKSTLIKILGGVYGEYDGVIEIEGRSVRPCSPLEASELGVAVIHQELSLVPSLSVADNIFLGRPRTKYGFIDDKSQKEEAGRLLDQLGVHVNPDVLIEKLPIATQQLIEIAKALGQNARVIIMDEPTSALSSPEVEKLFTLIDDLKKRGCGIVYITHKMGEIQRIADRITVLRDGNLVGSAPASELDTAALIKWMVGREIDRQFPRHVTRPGEECLRLEDFTVFKTGRSGGAVVKNVSLSVRSGEILGIGGLQGSGSSELMTGLFGGYGKRCSGQVIFQGKPVTIHNPIQAIDMGIALLTNDRKATGLILSMNIIANVTLADLKRLTPGGWLRFGRERKTTQKQAEIVNIRAASLDMNVDELSGGNQQKVVLAKWLQTEPRLLLLDEPTRGIDVGAKREIYQLMNEWTARGIAIILITSEMPELLAMSDRIVVMHRGEVTGEFSREEAAADKILEAAMGEKRKGSQA